MDEDDFHDRPKRRKTPRRGKPGWEKTLLDQIRLYILRETDDYIIRNYLTADLHLEEMHVAVGQCLASLVKEGLLVYQSVDPKKYPEIYIRPSAINATKITWQGEQWIWGEYPVFRHKGFGNYKGHRYSIQRDRRKLRSKRDVTKAQRKNPIVPVAPADWNGKAYFIIRGTKFKQACAAIGVPADPKSDWTCPQCRKTNRYDDLGCTSYASCNYRRPHMTFWPPVVRSVICKRCGVLLKPGLTKHEERICNEIIVSSVMET